MKRQESETNYPFDWMDQLVEITLNPEFSELDQIPAVQFTEILQRLEIETTRIWKDLNNTTFSLQTNEQITVVVGLHYTAIKLLIDQVRNNWKAYAAFEALSTAGNKIISILEVLKGRIWVRYAAFLQELVLAKDTGWVKDPTSKPKVTCTLTVDQIGIILKAADESKIIIASSLSMVFKKIVPYLSTSFKNDLSWDSMRSNAYHPEIRDKEAAISALNSLIKVISEH